MNVGWLLDSSALAVAHHPEVVRRLRPMMHAGVLYSCPVLDLEALSAAQSPDGYRRMSAERGDVYRSAPLVASIGDRALALQGKLSRRAHDHEVQARDLVVAATALEHNLTVLHYHPAFQLLGELCELDETAIAPLGSLP
jgi:predicted nucleic acid-binding protein